MQIWNSRRKLLLNSIFLTFLAILLRYDILRPYDCIPAPPEKNSFMEDVYKAVEEFDYIYAAQRGRAKIMPVVEKPKELEEHRPCRVKLKRGSGKERKGWVENERWYMFSAYLDERYNSLYPEIKSIQVGKRDSLDFGLKTPNFKPKTPNLNLNPPISGLLPPIFAQNL